MEIGMCRRCRAFNFSSDGLIIWAEQKMDRQRDVAEAPYSNQHSSVSSRQDFSFMVLKCKYEMSHGAKLHHPQQVCVFDVRLNSISFTQHP